MKPLGCAPYPQTRRHPKTADGADASHLCTSKRYDPKADELLLGTDAVDVVVKATVTRAGQIAAATENSIAEPAPSTAETSAGSSRFLPVIRVTSSRAHCRERPRRRRTADERDEVAAFHRPMPPVLPAERIAHLGTADCCIHPPGRNETIAITPPKIFSKEVAQKQATPFPPGPPHRQKSFQTK